MIVLSTALSTEFEQLYLENHKKVYRLALSLTGNSNDAEEITQEAFFKAFRSYDTYRKDSSFFTWIYRITSNLASDYMKHRSKMPMEALTEDFGFSLEDIIDETPENNPETQLLLREVKYKCLHCLTECLPDDQRKIFCLAITIGLPHKQVAEILECSLSKVKTTLHRAKQRWLGYMENRCSRIKKTNPCRCEQWIRFGLKQGWISKKENIIPHDPFIDTARDEILELRNLRDIYSTLYSVDIDESLTSRIKKGIENKEWKIIS